MLDPYFEMDKSCILIALSMNLIWSGVKCGGGEGLMKEAQVPRMTGIN